MLLEKLNIWLVSSDLIGIFILREKLVLQVILRVECHSLQLLTNSDQLVLIGLEDTYFD